MLLIGAAVIYLLFYVALIVHGDMYLRKKAAVLDRSSLKKGEYRIEESKEELPEFTFPDGTKHKALKLQKIRIKVWLEKKRYLRAEYTKIGDPQVYKVQSDFKGEAPRFIVSNADGTINNLRLSVGDEIIERMTEKV